MKKALSLFALLLFSVSCTPSAEDFVSDLFDDYEYEDEEEYYECSLGDASLPFGTHPEELITPEGYEWECTGGGANSIRFDSDGTFSVALSTVAYSVALDYFSDCSGYPSREETGEWIVDVRGRLCIKLDNIQPGLYNCQRLAYGSGTVRGSTCVDYYENGDYLGQECDRDNRLGTCTLVEE